MRSGPFRAPDGTELHGEAFLPEGEPRAGILYLHGYGEHGGRHAHVARRLAARGFAVFVVDYRGHGRAGGRRGHCFRFDEFLGDAHAGAALVRRQIGDRPLVLVGHSHGALILLRMLAEAGRAPAGVVGAALSSPFLGIGMPVPRVKVLAGKIASRVLPTLSLPSGLDPRDFTHDEEVIAVWRRDPLIHHVATARWFTEAAAAQDYVAAQAGRIGVPTLWLYGENDRVADPSITPRVAARVPGAEVRGYPGLYHEIFNEREPEREKILAALDEWLDRLVVRAAA